MKKSRILICGISGAGKTTLAKKLAQQFGYEALYLDSYLWKENWTICSNEELFKKLDAKTAGDCWILEGALLKVVRRYISQVDIVIWLRPKRHTAIFRILKRAILNFGQVREEFAPGCNERIDFEFLKWVWSYPKSKDPELIKIFEDSGVQVLELTNYNFTKIFELLNSNDKE